jgi:hypothetical protein
MFKRAKGKKKQNATPLDRLWNRLKETIGGLAGRTPRKGKAKTRARAKSASGGTRRTAKSTNRKAKSATR